MKMMYILDNLTKKCLFQLHWYYVRSPALSGKTVSQNQNKSLKNEESLTSSSEKHLVSKNHEIS